MGHRTATHAVVLLFSSVLLGACSYSYIDDQGTRHVIGLVKLELPAEQDSTFAGQVVDITTLGIHAATNEEGSSLSLGYNREISGYLRDHALVVGNPLAISPDHNREGPQQ